MKSKKNHRKKKSVVKQFIKKCSKFEYLQLKDLA